MDTLPYVLLRKTEGSDAEHPFAIADVVHSLSIANITEGCVIAINPGQLLQDIPTLIASGVWEYIPVTTSWPAGGLTVELETWAVQKLLLDSVLNYGTTVKTIERNKPQPKGQPRQYKTANLPAISVSCGSGPADWEASATMGHHFEITVEVITQHGTLATGEDTNRAYRDRALYCLKTATTDGLTYQFQQEGVTTGEPELLDNHTWRSSSKLTGMYLVPDGE